MTETEADEVADNTFDGTSRRVVMVDWHRQLSTIGQLNGLLALRLLGEI